MSDDRLRVAIVGSRTWTDVDRIRALVNRLDVQRTVVVSGGAAGADRIGVSLAKERGIACCVIKPDWDTYGRRAGFMRNAQIVASVSVVYAFWQRGSAGTKHTIDSALKATHIKQVVVFKG